MNNKEGITLVEALIGAIIVNEIAASLHPDYKRSRGVLVDGVLCVFNITGGVVGFGLLFYFSHFISWSVFCGLLGVTFFGTSILVFHRYQAERELEIAEAKSRTVEAAQNKLPQE